MDINLYDMMFFHGSKSKKNSRLPFGIQGLLYLLDVKEYGGVFSCVPASHKKIDKLIKQFYDESKARNLKPRIVQYINYYIDTKKYNNI